MMTTAAKISSVVILVCISLACLAQERQEGRGRFANMDRAFGTIDSITGDRLVLKTPDGKSTTVKLTSETQFRKDRQPAKSSDFKAGDRVIAAGKLGSDGVLVAQFVGGGQMRGGPGSGGPWGGPGGGQPPSPEEMVRIGLGTRFIAGAVKKIDETKLTVLRPDGQTQVIEADENTSFRNGKDESVTLADVKVGDHIAGRGDMKNGVFVPQVLRVGVQFPQRPPEQRPDDKQ